MQDKKKKEHQDQKSTYEKPAVIYKQVLESFAGSCNEPDPVNGKTGNGDLCTVIGN